MDRRLVSTLLGPTAALFAAFACGSSDGHTSEALDGAVDGTAHPSGDGGADGANGEIDAGVGPCSALTVPAGTLVAGPTVSVHPDADNASCFEAWAKATPTGQVGSGKPAMVLGQGARRAGEENWFMYCFPDYVEADVLGTGGIPVPVWATVPCHDGAFHHYALCFAGGMAELYFDGVLRQSKVVTPAVASGALNMGSYAYYWDTGTTTIDEVRFSTGHRYTGPFTPARRLAADAKTRLLYHFDEGAGAITAEATGQPALTLPSDSLWATTCP